MNTTTYFDLNCNVLALLSFYAPPSGGNRKTRWSIADLKIFYFTVGLWRFLIPQIIPVSSIGLALLHCSTRVHCNPEKQILIERKISNELQKTKNVLAADTQTLTPAKPVSEDGKSLKLI